MACRKAGRGTGGLASSSRNSHPLAGSVDSLMVLRRGPTGIGPAVGAETMRITLYMLRSGVSAGPNVLRTSDFDEVPLKPAPSGTTWRLFIRSRPPTPPRWLASLVDITQQAPGALFNASSAAVLLVSRGKSSYAITFGTGYHALDASFIQRGFGLQVTANAIAADRMLSADTKRLEKSGPSQKVILPVASQLYELGIEPTEEWVKQLSGHAIDKSFASTAAGSDSLRLSIDNFALKDLPSKLDAIEAKYNDTAYKTNFGFLDDLRIVPAKDPIVEALNDKVTALLRAQSDDLAFAAPDPFQQIEVEYFNFKFRKDAVSDSLSTRAVFEALSNLNLGPDPLKGVRVDAFDSDGLPVDKTYPLGDYVQAEVDHSGRKFVLTSGIWFEVAADFVAEVRNFVAGVPDITASLHLPTWPETTWKNADEEAGEGRYNELVAKTLGYSLMDKKNVTITGHQRVEVCDLLTPSRHLICIKRASRSSSLSHLFAQGSVSATLMFEPKYNDHVHSFLLKVNASATHSHNPQDWTFVYAIATDKQGSLADTLFFFSQVHLRTHVRHITERGFRVALARIQLA